LKELKTKKEERKEGRKEGRKEWKKKKGTFIVGEGNKAFSILLPYLYNFTSVYFAYLLPIITKYIFVIILNNFLSVTSIYNKKNKTFDSYLHLFLL
jgi:hypothetical protein